MDKASSPVGFVGAKVGAASKKESDKIIEIAEEILLGKRDGFVIVYDEATGATMGEVLTTRKTVYEVLINFMRRLSNIDIKDASPEAAEKNKGKALPDWGV